MGKSQRRGLESYLAVLLQDVLKWHAQPDRRCKSWRGTIKLQRLEIADLLEEMLA
jgi:hypothetical protein